MTDLSTAAFFNGQHGGRRDIVMGGSALFLAAVVFYIDTFTPIESAIAVLYAIALLMAGEFIGRSGIHKTWIVFCSLAVFSFLYGHGLDGDPATILRLVVALAAISITAILLLRGDRFRSKLIDVNADLHESELRYRSIFDRAGVALWERDYSQLRQYLMELKTGGVTDLRRHLQEHPEILAHCAQLIRTITANAAVLDLLGVAAAETGSHRNFVIPDECFLESVVAVFERKISFEGKGQVATGAGETRSVLVSIRFPDEAIGFTRVVVGMLDITARERAQQALIEARAEMTRASKMAAVGVMSASLAHELNQPLGAIVVNSQTLMRWLDRDPPDLAAARRTAERLIRDSSRATDIVQNTRALLSQTQVVSDWIDLNELLNETRALMDHDLQRNGVVLVTDQATAVPLVKSIRIELQQVLVNLLSNAIQAMDQCPDGKKRIEISVALDGDDAVQLAVRDTGPGISEEAAEKIFAPFYTTKSSGMGMGLSICQSALEARGGRVVACNHPDGGAVFKMILPIEDEHA